MKITKFIKNRFKSIILDGGDITSRKNKKDSPENKYPKFIYGYLSGYLSSNKRIGIIQCGANDGITVDPIFDFMKANIDSVGAVLIEPLPEVFDLLSERYRNRDNIITINKAVGPKGDIDLYRIKREYSEYYRGIIASGITSFNRDYVLKKAATLLDLEGVPPEDRIEKLTVETMSLTRIYEQHKEIIGNEPFVQIDTEGFDDQVIFTIDFNVLQPIAINYEFCHLNEKSLNELRGHLRSKGYQVFQWSRDDEVAIRLN